VDLATGLGLLAMVCSTVLILSCFAVAASANPPQFALTRAPPKVSEPDASLCSPCVQLGGQALNILINALLNGGVIGGCGKLCGNLKSKGAEEACDLVCSIVGIKAFIKALNHTDLDPIYFCELLHACEAGPDDAHVDLLSVQLNPAKISEKDIQPGSGGATLEGVLTMNVTKHIGVGEFSVVVHGPVSGAQGPIGSSFVIADGLKEGVQNLGVKLNVQDTLPDPSKQPPEFPVTWMPGSYSFAFHLCQGECGSKHPHSIDFGRKAGNFTITKESQNVVV